MKNGMAKGFCEWELMKPTKPLFEGIASPDVLCVDGSMNPTPSGWQNKLTLLLYPAHRITVFFLTGIGTAANNFWKNL